jgi:SAM-dependent methyltransferase
VQSPPSAARPAHRVSSSRRHLERFAQAAADSVPAGALVLDAGAGDAPYAPLFSDKRYETADFTQGDRPYVQPTYVCDLASIPVEDCRFDLVFCSQVLEHVPRPSEVIAELTRVLKPGGRLWLSAPLFYDEHEQPYDFHRYTQFGLKHHLEGAGLEVEHLAWLEGYLGTLGYQLRMAASALPRDAASWGGSRIWPKAARAASPLLRWLGARLDHFDEQHPATSSGMPKNYIVVARRN